MCKWQDATTSLVEAFRAGKWPTGAAVVDYGLEDQQHYDALCLPFKNGEVTEDQLDDAMLGGGLALTALAQSLPSNPYKDIVFHTPRDNMQDEGGVDEGCCEDDGGSFFGDIVDAVAGAAMAVGEFFSPSPAEEPAPAEEPVPVEAPAPAEETPVYAEAPATVEEMVAAPAEETPVYAEAPAVEEPAAPVDDSPSFESSDSGSSDSGSYDSGTSDSGSYDSGTSDSGSYDSGSYDSGSCDSGSFDSGSCDSGSFGGD